MEANISAFLASLNSQPAYSESTCLAYASDLRVFLEYLQKTLERSPLLEDLDGKQVAGFLENEYQVGRRKSTLMRRRATLRRFVAYLTKEGKLQENVLDLDTELIDQALSRVSPVRASAGLSKEQIELLWEVVEASQRPRARRDQAILSLLLDTGLSVGTLVALDLSDLDLENGRLHLALENGEDIWLQLGNSAGILERYLREGRPGLHHQPDEPALFISQLGRRISRQGVWQIFRHWGRLVDPSLLISPRLVRHTAALNMFKNGRPVDEIQALLGHSNPLSTQALLRRLESAS